MAASSSFHHLSNSSSSQYPNTAFFSSCVSQYYNQQEVMNNETCVFGVRNKNSTDSSSVVTHYTTPKTTKRKSQHHPPSPNCAQSKDMRQVIKGNKKQKKMKDSEENEAAPSDYIHVRARRGQATDSHSLAERVRRERISERMKFLQALVPGCDKVTGKALMLDEIINYVQSLQNQVEFLSMKLAYVNPMFYDFGMDLESFRVEPEQSLSSLPSPLAAGMQQCSPTTGNTYTLLDNSLHLLQPPQIPNALSQGHRQVLWEVEEERHRVINESGNSSSTLFSFH